MPVTPRTIAVFLDGSAPGQRRALQAAALAKRWDAHLVGVYAVFKGATPHPSVTYARSQKGIAGVVAHESRIEDACEQAASDLRDGFAALCAEFAIAGEFRQIDRVRTSDAAIMAALHSDLIVIGHPEPSGLPEYLSAESLQVSCGLPLLVVPNAWQGDTIGRTVLIAWNASPEARRSVSDAMAFLLAASSVAALIVDPAGCKWFSRDEGDISRHLGRHGVQIDLEEVTSGGRSIDQVIVRRAETAKADLLVIGARSPASLRAVFAGRVTRALLANVTVPTLVSR